MGCERVIPTLAVGQVSSAVAWYRDLLGCRQLWAWGDPPAHAAVALDGVEIHLSSAKPRPGGAWLYVIVSDVDALRDDLVRRGVRIAHEPHDEEWGMRELSVHDLVGNELVFAQPCLHTELSQPVALEAVEA